LQEILGKAKDNIYLAGGTVPYFLANQDSERFHDDIDTICSVHNIGKLREILKNTEYYKPEWDSLNTAKDGIDYGFEIQISGIPVGIYPFLYENGKLTQYTYDPYTRQCKVKSFTLENLSYYIMSYKSKDDKTYNTMSLEYIKKSKDMIGRPKDLTDSKKIDELCLIRPDVLRKIEIPSKTHFVEMEK